MRLKALKTHTYANRQLRPGAVYSSLTPAHGRFLIVNGLAERFTPDYETKEEPSRNEAITRQEPEQTPPAPKKGRGRKKKVKSPEDAQNSN